MKCVYCGGIDSKVIDSRLSEDGYTVRRRRECISCGKRFTTYEKVESTPVLVIKNKQQADIRPVEIRTVCLKLAKKDPCPQAS